MIVLILSSHNGYIFNKAEKAIDKDGTPYYVWFILDKLQLRENFKARGIGGRLIGLSYDKLLRMFTPEEMKILDPLDSFPQHVIDLLFMHRDDNRFAVIMGKDGESKDIQMMVDFPAFQRRDTQNLVSALTGELSDNLLDDSTESYRRDRLKAYEKADKENTHQF